MGGSKRAYAYSKFLTPELANDISWIYCLNAPLLEKQTSTLSIPLNSIAQGRLWVHLKLKDRVCSRGRSKLVFSPLKGRRFIDP